MWLRLIVCVPPETLCKRPEGLEGSLTHLQHDSQGLQCEQPHCVLAVLEVQGLHCEQPRSVPGLCGRVMMLSDLWICS